MTCNGTLINKEITKFILDNNIAVQVSVDGTKTSMTQIAFMEIKREVMMLF